MTKSHFVPATCDGCGGPLSTRPTWSKFGDFCTTRCRVKTWKRARTKSMRSCIRNCEICDADISDKRIDAKTCGETCRKRRQKRMRVDYILQHGRAMT